MKTKTIRWTNSCSGCTELVDGYNTNGYPWDAKAQCYVGSGCRECGYTGKRRMTFRVADDTGVPIPNTVRPEGSLGNDVGAGNGAPRKTGPCC